MNRSTELTTQGPKMQTILFASFALFSLLSVISIASIIIAIVNNTASQQAALTQQQQLIGLIQHNHLQQLSLHKLVQNWPIDPIHNKQAQLADIVARGREIVTSLTAMNDKQDELALAQSMLTQMYLLSPSPNTRPDIGALIDISNQLNIRLTSNSLLLLDRTQRHIGLLNWQSNNTLLLSCLALILLSQGIAWYLLAKHFVRPLMELRDALTQLMTPGATKSVLTPSNQEVAAINLVLEKLHTILNSQPLLDRIDADTGMHNHNAFNLHLKDEWHKAVRRHDTLCLLLIGVDKSLSLVDNHNADNHQNQQDIVVNVIKQYSARAQDFCAKLDDNLFAIIMSGTELEQGIKLAQQLNLAVCQSSHPNPPLALRPFLSISIGVAASSPNSPNSWDTLVSQAEEALFNAQNSGGNHCIAAPELYQRSSFHRSELNLSKIHR